MPTAEVGGRHRGRGGGVLLQAVGRRRSLAHPQPPVQITDTHCHLFLMKVEPRRAVEAALGAGVGRLVCVGIDPRSSRDSAELASEHPEVFSAAGMHPHTASELDASAAGEIDALAANSEVVGIGETGLDFFRMLSPREDQERSFRWHAALSRSSGKPLIVHVRDAWPRALEILAEESAESVVLHCFSGDAEIAGECAARGYFVSFAGNLTYPKNGHLREAAAASPSSRLLTETDSPYLAPQELRGRENEPANALSVVRELARVRSEPLEKVAEDTNRNAFSAFPGLD
ncbi:MAG: TatD family hydrolase [Actinomycetota bacterium]